MKLFTVCWASASRDDDDNNNAYCNVHGSYTSMDRAKEGLEECKDEFIEEIINNPDFDEADREYATQDLNIYGSVEEQYYELDYSSGENRNEVYIHIVETYLVA